MIQQILDYKNVLVQIEGMIAESPYKKGFIIDKVGIPAPTFYRKLKTYMEWNYYRKEDCIVKKRLHCTAVKGASEYPRKGWRQS